MIDILEKYLILESVEQQLTDAINNHQVVTLHYAGNNEGKVLSKKTKAGVRHILPVALGWNPNGNMIVRGYLTSTGIETPWRTHTTKVPLSPSTKEPADMDRWKTFRIDRITSVIPREGPNDVWNRPPAGFNNGDRGMKAIYALAKWEGQPETPEVPAPVSVPITKPETKIDKIPQGSKVVLKAPEKKKEPVKPAVPPAPPIKPPVPPVKPPVPPVQPPQATQPVQTNPPEEPEPTEPENINNQPKPISEWYFWLNKIVNN
jgi:hypothetical protein